ncbi:MAG: hypothetical protein D6715_11445 [Calditrichaeota bacterium]|nr:MAG: hypothetical protein D6715_11445 [Calditrichota bacterium]
MRFFYSIYTYLIAWLISLWMVWPSPAQQQLPTRLLLDLPPDTLIIKLDSTALAVPLPVQFIVPGTESIRAGSFRLLRGVHYRLDYARGVLRLKHALSGADSLQIVFRRYPFPVIGSYVHRELSPDSAGFEAGTEAGDSSAVVLRAKPSPFLEEISSYEGNLQKSGTLVRGIQIGSNQDLTLNSGLNLQLSGHITPDVEVVAALTDESTPLQPEGNTQTLREVDKVYVKINSPHVGGTLGDFNLRYENTSFGNVQRKLQGITVENQTGATRQQVTFGTSRGIFNSVSFLGQEGRQGPYQLTGKNGERDIIVLAGTERVYVDGQLQTRGENNDYIIDYGLGQITFTSKRLITSENRIEVDFEYTNSFQRYSKNFLGVSSQASHVLGWLDYDVRLFREWDDTNNLLEDSAPLTDQEREVLRQAGDDPLKAQVSGADSVGQGLGSYVRRDTTGQNGKVSYFEYVGRGKGDYTVRFTSVPPGQGSYRRVRLGVYEYVGAGKGNYLPIKLVPLAGDNKFVNTRLTARLGQPFSVSAEVGVSQFDQNVFSSLDDQDNQRAAFQLQAGYQQPGFRLLGRRLGKLSWQARYRRREANFAALDRQFRPEFTYRWDLDPSTLNDEETALETELTYQPVSNVVARTTLGKLDKGSQVSSRRVSFQLDATPKRRPEAHVLVEKINADRLSASSDWLRGSGWLSYRLGGIEPRIGFRTENRRVREPSGRLTGFFFQEGNANLKIASLGGLAWELSSTVRQDYLYNPRQTNQRLRLALTQTHALQASLRPNPHWQGQFSFLFREKDFTPFFEKLPSDSIPVYQANTQFQDTTWRDNQSHLANVNLQYRSTSGSFVGKWDYQVSSELVAQREKVFLEVGENRGNYRFDETLGEYVPDPQGNFLLFILPTGSFQNITRLETAWQLTYRPPLARKKVQRGTLGWLAQNLSTLTYVKIEEESKNRNARDIYLLNFSKFQDPATTLRGSLVINQDFNFFERHPVWGILLRSRYRNNLSNQFLDATNNEKRIVWERSLQVRRRLNRRKLTLTTTYRNTLNRRTVSSLSSRNRNILSQALEAALNYRPSVRWQLQLAAESGWERDRNAEQPLSVRYWELKPRAAYSLRGRARFSSNLSLLRVNVTNNPAGRPIPFEMGKGKKEGTSFLLNLRMEYFLSSNVTMTINYTGRRDAGFSRTIHVGTAEVRAFF